MTHPKFTDTEASSLADISERLRPEYEAADAMWIGSPFAVHAWFIPKAELMKPRPGLSHQHGGTKGTDTLWLSFSPDEPPSWLEPFGGVLAGVEELIRSAT